MLNSELEIFGKWVPVIGHLDYSFGPNELNWILIFQFLIWAYFLSLIVKLFDVRLDAIREKPPTRVRHLGIEGSLQKGFYKVFKVLSTICVGSK